MHSLFVALLLGQRPADLNVTPEQIRVGNLTRICGAAKRLALKNGGRFQVTPANVVEKLSRYLGNPTVFTAPGDTPGTVSYQLNAAMVNANLTTLKNPAKTVLFYIGKNNTLDFKFGGKAAVGCADGQGRYVTKAEAASLVWKP
ncbi:hypothetical protein [Armatimonas rosea]|uniref:Uncharacterized protein n=1 Tax=Armatimonas rosea TaxID=685828 RepID=A0A7W9SLI5_ARMRO|nr:hypothetical protein [Armatimonas rosea]MBB6048852.1 hypothetical protein [Armatimonas rosea]